MKLQLDTTAKTVKIESDIKVSLLIKTLKAMLPNDWKDFTLQTNTIIQHWTNPIIYQPYIQPYQQPWYFTCQSTNTYSGLTSGSNVTSGSNYISASSLKAGIYNVEI